MMIIECEILKGCRQGETSNRNEEFGKQILISTENADESITNEIIQLKDDKIVEMMEICDYFPIEDWDYQTKMYDSNLKKYYQNEFEK